MEVNSCSGACGNAPKEGRQLETVDVDAAYGDILEDFQVASAELSAIQAELIAREFEVKEHEHSVNAQMKGSDLRIQFTVDQRYQKFLADTNVQRVLGENIPVASLENIVRRKVWAWSDPKRRLSKRKKDELDLIRIAEKYPEVRKLIPPAITNQLEN